MHTELVISPNPWMATPFGLLLASIALAPLLIPGWWNKHYPKVAIALGMVTIAYYLFGLKAPGRLLHVAHEYVSFIALIGSLFVVAGGIHVTVKGEGTPRANVLFLLVGALVANVLGTTGASMLLIRPWLRMNKYRLTAHHVVFFIFVVSNVGGCLTPIGDPPLFLGYLKGVPFWWVAKHCWPMWAVGVGFLLAVFYLIDRRNYLRAPVEVRERLAEPPDRWRIDGLGNLVLLAAILGSVFLKRPPFLREAIMIAAAVTSWVLTPPRVHEANRFNFHPLKEVAILFMGIFATMIPALDWLQLHAADFGRPTPGRLYWLTGSLSSVLDNAPTYLTFLSAAAGAYVSPELIAQVRAVLGSTGSGGLGTSPGADIVQLAAMLLRDSLGPGAAAASAELIRVACLLSHSKWSLSVVAVSVGAVFFGAATYIGNGPNFMVKAIAEEGRAHVPTFIGYVFKYTIPLLVPMLALIWLVFFLT
jgi:Na+/H+ antiporter NhaD/arsenite permease-like protein